MIFLSALLLTTYWTTFAVHCAPDRHTEPEVALCHRIIDEAEANRLQIQYPGIDRRENHGYDGMAEMSTVFVDKSLIIKEILEIKEKVLVMHLPPLWTKTMILSMLKYFFEMRVSRRTNKVIPPTNCSSYKFFTEGVLLKADDNPLQSNSLAYRYIFGMGSEEEPHFHTAYTKPPLISKHKDIIDKHLCRYPVIFLDLWAGNEYHHPSTIGKFLMNAISMTFKKFMFIETMFNDTLRDEKLDDKRRKTYEEYSQKFRVLANMFHYYVNESYVENSFVFLSEILYKLFDKRVIILVDEYSHILDYYSYREGPYEDEKKTRYAPEIKKDVELFRKFLWKTLNDNPYLEKAIVTGMRLNMSDYLLSDYRDTKIYTGNDNHLLDYYGLNKVEVKWLFDIFHVPDEHVEAALLFYEECAIPKLDSDVIIYNTFSIVTFVHHQLITDNWACYVNTKRIIDWGAIYDPLNANAFHRANFRS